MQPLRIAIISPEFPPLTNWGGFATFNQQLFNLLTGMGHDVHVITYDGNGSGKSNQLSGHIHYVPFRTRYKIINWMYFRFPFGIFRNFFMKKFPCVAFAFEWNVFVLPFFIRLNKTHKFQIIHTPTPVLSGWLIKIFYPNISLVIHVQGLQAVFNTLETKTLDLRIRAWLENKYIQYIGNHIVTCSNFESAIVHKILPKLGNKIVTIHNFLNVQYAPTNTHIQTNNLVYVGRLEYRKGVDIIVKSFISLAKTDKKISLYLIGKDSGCFNEQGKILSLQSWLYCQPIPSYISKRIHYIPQIDDRDSLFQLLNSLKGIGVFPARYEPFGFVTLELMALGYLVIASNESGSREIIINSKNGFLVDPESKDLIQCIRQIQLLTAKAVEHISNEAKYTAVMHYNQNSVKKPYQALYEKIICNE